jgi:hypothetical protein
MGHQDVRLMPHLMYVGILSGCIYQADRAA